MAKDRPPSIQFYPRDYMADPDVQAMTWEQRGRYHWAICCSALSATPGVAHESDWARWMGYDPAGWEASRDVHARCFKVGADGLWTQARLRDERRDQRARFQSAKEAGRLSGVARRLKVPNETRTECERNANETRTPREGSTPASASASAVESKAKIAAAAAPDSAEPTPKPDPPPANATAPPVASEPATRPETHTNGASPPQGNLGAYTRSEVLALVGGAAQAIRMPASVTGKLDVDRVARSAASLGPDGVKTAIQLATRWWKAGLRQEGLLDRLVSEYVSRAARIGNPFAYFNGKAFEAMRLRWAGDLSAADGAELAKLERAFAAEVKAAVRSRSP